MSPIEFCAYLDGFIELNGGAVPTPEQWDTIRKRLHFTTGVNSPPKAKVDVSQAFADVLNRKKYEDAKSTAWPAVPQNPFGPRWEDPWRLQQQAQDDSGIAKMFESGMK